MIEFSKGENSIFIKLFPVWLYIQYHKFILVEFGILSLCIAVTISLDGSTWDD